MFAIKNRALKISPSFWWILFLSGLVIITHLSIFSLGYFGDDFNYVLRARANSFSALAAHALYEKQPQGSWRPFSELSLTPILKLNGNSEFQYGVSLALYVILSAVIFYFVRLCLPNVPQFWQFIIALTAGLAPAHLEPVAWLAARGDILVVIFGLGATIAWMRSRTLLTIILYAGAMLTKETWIFLPLALFMIKKPRLRPALSFAGVAAFWFLFRYYITGFVVGGYALPNPLAGAFMERVWREAASFFASALLFGEWQSQLAEFARANAPIILLPVFLLLYFLYKKTPATRSPLTIFAVVLAPTLLLNVPTVSGMESVAEQRYWFAPALLLVICILVFVFNWLRGGTRYLITVVLLLFFLTATRHEIRLFENAAHYRDNLLTEWKQISAGKTTANVALLPDTWQGVHLFAEPFFSNALIIDKQTIKITVIPVYQTCGKICEKEAAISRTKDRVFLTTLTKRMFEVGQKPRFSETAIMVDDGGLFLWTGAHWRFIEKTSNEAEKNKP